MHLIVKNKIKSTKQRKNYSICSIYCLLCFILFLFIFFFLDLWTPSFDLIILALLDNRLKVKEKISAAARWANENRAQVLVLDPPKKGTPGLTAKYSLVPALPLAYDSCNGKIYLCNLNIPQEVFTSVGITEYVSPFGPKFFMALYPNNI